MSALKSAVSQGLYAQGLDVVDDRGGLSVRDLDPEMPVSIWVDETERVIRAEAPLCYPIDDYSPDLALAIDHLNRIRSGIVYSYREANRALVVSSSWTSPNRNPSESQLHALMALLLDAKDRDGPGLWRVAEGESGWDEVVEDTGAHASQTMRFADDTGVSTGGTGKFSRAGTGAGAGVGSGTEANRWSEMMQMADVAEEASNTRKWQTDIAGSMAGDGGGGPPTRRSQRPTRNLDQLDDVPTRRFDADEDHGAMPGGDQGYDPEQPYEGETPKRLSRHALHAAVSSLDNAQHERVDMTRQYSRSRSGGAILKFLFVVGVIGGSGYGFAYYYQKTTGQSIIPDMSFFEEKLMSEVELKLKARQAIAPGKDLLVAELQDPLPGEAHASILDRALGAMDSAEVAETLEGMFARSPNAETRVRAHELWVAQGFADREGAVIAALKLLNENKRSTIGGDPVLQGLLGELRSSPPPDETVHVAFAWAQDDVWKALVDILGRPEDGPGDDAEARAKMLEQQLAKDTPDKLALQALVKTGYAPKRAAFDLVVANGLKWATGAGEPLLRRLLERDVSYFEPLLGIDDVATRLLTIEFLVRAGRRDSVDLLVRVMRTDASEEVRLRAVKALGELGLPEAIWPLALELNRTPKTETETKVRDAALAALKRLPEGDVVREIETHMDPERPIKERLWSVLALGQLESPAAVLALVEVGLRDPDERLRRHVIKTLGEQGTAARTSLQRGLSVLRDVGRNDPSETVRKEANRLYQELIRR